MPPKSKLEKLRDEVIKSLYSKTKYSDEFDYELNTRRWSKRLKRSYKIKKSIDLCKILN